MTEICLPMRWLRFAINDFKTHFLQLRHLLFRCTGPLALSLRILSANGRMAPSSKVRGNEDANGYFLFLSVQCILEFEASHGTVADLWHTHQRGEETSLNPLGIAINCKYYSSIC